MSEKYENIELIKEEAEVLQELEKQFGVPLSHVDKITWDDYKIDEQTHQIEKYKVHQFGFISKDQHVVELGLGFDNINEKKLNLIKRIPKISKLTNLKAIDVSAWGEIFSEFINETKRRQVEFQKSQHRFYKSIEERRKAVDDALRATRQPNWAPNAVDLYKELIKLENLEYLDASNCKIVSIQFLQHLKNLKFLNLSNNLIEKIEKALSVQENLHTLMLHDNPLKIFPADIASLKSLKILDLSDTKIQELPEHIGNIEFLEELSLPLQIIRFPQSFIHLKSLKTLVANDFPDHFKELKSLETIIINSGKMEVISDGLTELISLKSLIITTCRSLKKLPEHIGNLKSLTVLKLTGNSSLEFLPKSIFNLSNLQTLNLYNNNLKEFLDKLSSFPRLEILTLNNNQLTHLPYSVFKLNNLIDFSIDNNPLVLNDKLISAKTLPEIKEYSKKKMAINVFISHAVVDYEPCRLEQLSLFLQKQLEVDIAFLCERDLSGNIDGFMDKNVPQSQLVLFIATPTSVNSVDCQYELKLSREYNVQVVPVKAKELDWGDLAKIGLNRELGMECDFSDIEKFDEFCQTLYDYIKQLKRQIDLHDKEQGKIDRLTIGLKMLERKVDILTEKIEKLEKPTEG
ncbi:leucine-rich repeat domain-containing protein [Promethearchaeum syntrophicum]|uniref:Leucine-rich repeat domain-containing protein n=1 Tax=Promethearchaeum syntrophicum TaxID=2594042 RepID=A0A5B9D5N6_9ARCH|nr:leucine-rich repeat domain-containing protein [Candidatus Prometheoarchaeum syntrophicum]QEE14251.1 Leucine Rich repeats (2 copies) [Candidatus Prometheoarchaeum syntrophicum]